MEYRLFTYSGQDRPAAGIQVVGRLYDLDSLARAWGAGLGPGTGVDALLDSWSESHRTLRQLAASVADDSSGRSAAAELAGEPRFLAPLVRPGVIYAAGANHGEHVEAMARAFDMKLNADPKADGVPPWHFIKAGRGTLSGHRHEVRMPADTGKLDWEAELAVVIGRRASKVDVREALDFVAGYTCANDLSARDHLVREQVHPTSPFRFDWIGHKCFTGSCPLGPFLTPSEFVGSPENLRIRLWRNGELEQDSNTGKHLYSVAEQIAFLTRRLDLFPGDIIMTGTPAGVGMETGRFLSRGDTLKVAIEKLGELETRIV